MTIADRSAVANRVRDVCQASLALSLAAFLKKKKLWRVYLRASLQKLRYQVVSLDFAMLNDSVNKA